ncbi:flagellar hook-length control protein FliK [Photobacterium minamisatsumaniensis]|uniref:flagellar hook-length control protein FliK n=1 Tax=Photobacterium minamisatsumaniensis TaxID=2910233 RepID=UPI003D09A6F1
MTSMAISASAGASPSSSVSPASNSEHNGDNFAALLGLAPANHLDGSHPEESNAYWFDLYDQLKGLAEGEDWVFSTGQPFIEQLPPEGQFRLINITNQLGDDVRDQLLGMMRHADGLRSTSVQLGQVQPAMPHHAMANSAVNANAETVTFPEAIERVISNAMTPVRQEMTNPVLIQQLNQANAFTTLSLQDASPLQASEASLSSQATNNTARAEWAPVKMAENQQQWGQQLVSVLKDRVQMHLNQDVQHARIRLDPPHLGALELSVKVENNKVQIHIAAIDPALREAVQQGAERLRAELEGKQLAGATVDVDVSEQSQQDHTQPDSASQLVMQQDNTVSEPDGYISQDLFSKTDEYRLTRMV